MNVIVIHGQIFDGDPILSCHSVYEPIVNLYPNFYGRPATTATTAGRTRSHGWMLEAIFVMALRSWTSRALQNPEPNSRGPSAALSPWFVRGFINRREKTRIVSPISHPQGSGIRRAFGSADRIARARTPTPTPRPNYPARLPVFETWALIH